MHALRAKGLRHGNNRIARLMREQHLRVRQKRRFVPRTTIADKTAAAAPNHLLQRSTPKRLNEVWVTGICFATLTLRAALRAGCLGAIGSYLPTREGWLYLSAEMDLCSRRILGWSTREELPGAALECCELRTIQLNNKPNFPCPRFRRKIRHHIPILHHSRCLEITNLDVAGYDVTRSIERRATGC